MPSDVQAKSVQSHHPPTGSNEVTERLQGLLQQLIAPKSIPHAIVAVETVDRSFRWVGAAGDAHPDGTPMREETPIWIASVTKLYIASTILKLCEQNLVRLDAPMSAYLPQSLIGGLHRLDGVDYTEQITIQHLLGHLTGLPDYFFVSRRGEKGLMDRLIEQDTTFTIEEALQIVRDATPHFPPQPLDAERPKISYSDTNYQLLIEIIEAVTGQSLHKNFQEMLFDPLQLHHTFLPGTLDGPEPEAATTWFEDKPLDIPLAKHSARDLISTVDDMLEFMRALVRGEVFEHPGTLQHMMENWNSFGFNLNPMQMGWPIQYGQGMMRLKMPRIFSPFRSIPAVVGHTGFCGSWLFYCPERDLLLAGTVDQGTAGAVPFRFVPKLLNNLTQTPILNPLT
jgi:D-alanyl-D-alanine carboxypeptidase